MLVKLPKDKTTIWQIKTGFGPIDMMCAEYYTQNFAKHSHDNFPLGVIEQGAMSFYFRRQNLVASKGTVNLSYPGEVHNGLALGASGWKYRMFYFDLKILRQIFAEFKNRKSDLPFFPKGVIEDDYLASYLYRLHTALEEKQLTAMEIDTFIMQTISYMILKHSDQNCHVEKSLAKHSGIQMAQDYIISRCNEDISLSDVARVVGLSPFHFSRLFLHQTGTSPHAFLIQARIRKVRRLLFSNMPLADIALEVGFVDQSHLNRRFKQIFGVTPHQYRKIIQD